MQATHYVPDEIERRHGIRDTCTLKSHHDFAAEVLGEKQTLSQTQMVQQGANMFHDLLVFTSDRPWIFFVWSIEIFWMIFIATACTMEMWGACSFELGATSYCTYCYSGQLLTFLGVLAVLWIFNLYTYVLLLSRGFQMQLRFLGLTVQKNAEKGIPRMACYLFMFLSTLMFVWLIGGVITLIMSNSCLRSGLGPERAQPGRSQLMFWTCVATLVLTPLLCFMGRCEDAKAFCRSIF